MCFLLGWCETGYKRLDTGCRPSENRLTILYIRRPLSYLPDVDELVTQSPYKLVRFVMEPIKSHCALVRKKPSLAFKTFLRPWSSRNLATNYYFHDLHSLLPSWT